MSANSLIVTGTPFRGQDKNFLSAVLWEAMRQDVIRRVNESEITKLVSGGSGGSEFLAVQLFNEGLVPELELHFPGILDKDGFQYRFYDEASHEAKFVAYVKHVRILNGVHASFQEQLGVNSLVQTYEAVQKGASFFSYRDFFKSNVAVGEAATRMVVYTFSTGWEPNDGGTSKTWEANRAAFPDGERVHVSLVELLQNLAKGVICDG